MRDPIAKTYACLALQFGEQHGVKAIARAAQIALDVINQDEGNFDLSKQHFLNALEMIQGDEAIKHQIEILEGLIAGCKQQGDYQSAQHYHQLHEEAIVFQTRQRRDRQIHIIEIRLEVSRMEYERDLYRVCAQESNAVRPSKRCCND